MIKTYSFTTDDDDSPSVISHISVTNKRRILDICSPSKDSFQNNNDSAEINIKQRKNSKLIDENRKTNSEKKNILDKQNNWSILLKLLGIGFLLFLLWINRDVWFHRFLSSNNRTHVHSSENELSLSPETNIVKVSPGQVCQKEDNIEENHRENVHFHAKQSNKENQIRLRNPKANKLNRPLSRYSAESQSNEKQSLSLANYFKRDSSNFNRQTSTYNEIIKQMRKNIKTRIHNRDFLSKLSKKTGLTKGQIRRFVYRNESSFFTLQTFISFLDEFNLGLFIVP